MTSSPTALVGEPIDLTGEDEELEWQDESAVTSSVDLTEEDDSEGPILPEDEENDELLDESDLDDDDDDIEEVDASTFAASQFRELASVESELGVRIWPGKSYELRNEERFFRVSRIFVHRHTGKTTLQGHLLCRLKKHQLGGIPGMFSKPLNELIILMEAVHPGRSNPELQTHMVEMPLSAIYVEREIIFTNLPFANGKFDDCSFRDAPQLRLNFVVDENRRRVQEHFVLVCRWKSVEYAGSHGRSGKHGALLRLRQHEADARHSIPDAALEHWWRSEEELGKAPTQIPPSWSITVDGDDQLSANAARPGFVPEKRVAADFACGIGGSMTGIESAGLRVGLCLDKDIDAIKSIRVGFTLARSSILHMKFDEYCALPRRDRVDTLHLSYPCQPYSPMNTRISTEAGRIRNEENMDAALCAIDLARALRPKQITLEQTAGILRASKVESFSRLVNQLTSCHYSLRWKIVKGIEHGVPSMRPRLVIFAACAGHPLADTLIPRSGPIPSIHQVLLPLQGRFVPPHMRAHTLRSGAPPTYDPHMPLRRTILTGGVAAEEDVHPRFHRRGFNLQEIAALMTFPVTHQFDPTIPMTIMRRLLGNAVPPALAHDMYIQVREALDRGDEAMAIWWSGVLLL